MSTNFTVRDPLEDIIAKINTGSGGGATPDATTTVKGIVQLAGDLDGTATAPSIGSNKVTYAKMQQVAASSLLGNPTGASANAQEVMLGTGLTLVGNTLNASAATPDATTTVKGIVQLAGDLDGTATAPSIGSNKVTYAKMQQVAASSLLGNPTGASANAQEVMLGTGLTLVGNTLNASAATPDATTTVKGIVQLAGDLDGTATAPSIGSNKVTYAKMQQVAASSLLGNPTGASANAQEVMLGTGLTLVGNTLNASAATPDATTTVKGIVQLAGDLDGTATAPSIGSNKVTYAKMQQVVGAKMLLGSQTAATNVSEIGLDSASPFNIVANNLTITTVPVSKGGTGSTTLTGYVKGTGTTPFSTVSNIPVVDVQGAVGSVNGILPVPINGGNVSILIGSVSTGILSALPPQPQTNGNIYVVSGDSTPVNNGRTFISDGTLWNEVTNNQASTDARYVIKSGDTMSGNLAIPTGIKITLADAPTGSTDATNKTYVDSQISSAATPDATTLIKGKIQLGGDLGGVGSVSAAPVISNTAVTNPKMNPGAASTLKGTNSLVAVDDIILGSGLSLTAGAAPTLSVDQSTFDKAGNAQFGVVEFDSSGDLVETAANSGIGVIKAAGVTNPKVNPGAASTLKGTNSLVAVDDIILGSGLSLTAGAAPTLSVDQSTFDKAGNAQFGVVEFDSSGDLVETAANSGIGVIKAAGVTNPKVNPGAASTLKGTNSLVAVDDIILGSGLSLTAGAAPTLSVDQSTFDKAGNAQFGVVEFDSSGDLVETAANSGIGVIKAAGVTNPKVNPGAASTLKGTNSLVAVDDIILGSGLSLTAGAAPTLSVDQSTFDKAGNAQFGVVEFDSSGDLVETAANSGIGVIKSAGVTNPKVNPGAASTLKGTNSLVAVDDIILGSGLSLTAGAAPTLSVDQSTFDKAGNAQFGVVEFDSSGDLVETAANSGIGVIKAAGVTNPKVNPGAASTLKGTNSLVAVDDIILGSGLSLTAGAAPTLSVDQSTFDKAGNAQFGVVEFDPSGDLVETAANSGIGVIKAAGVTNPKVNPGAASTLKGTNSLVAVDDIILGSGLSLTAGAAPTLSVDQSTFDKAGNAQFGVVEFDPSGDLVETAANSGIGVIKATGVTNPKVNPGAASTLKGTNSLVAVDDIILGSGLSLTAGAAPTLSVDQSTFDKAGNAQFGVVEFDSSGDLVETAANSGIGVIKSAGVTNPKVNPGAASTLKGTNSLVAVDDIILGSGLSLTAGAAPTLSVDQSTFDKAGNAQFGVVEFDSSGDLVETAANSGIGVIKSAGVTNPKVNPGAASTLKGTNSLVAVDDIILGSGLSLTAGAAPTLSVDQSTFDKAGNAQFGVVEFDSSGDLVETAANSGIGVIKAAGVTNPKVNPGAASTLKGTNSLVAVDDIILGSGLSLTAGAAPTLSVDQSTFDKAGNAQFGVVEFDSSGDLVETAANSGIGVIKAAGVTNPKVNPGAASTLKGTNSLVAVDDIILGSGLSLTAGAAPTLSVDQSTFDKAGNAQFGVVEFDPSGDLVETAANSGIGVIKAAGVTNPKVNPGAASTLKGTNSLVAVDDIILGSGLSLTAGAAPTLSVDQSTFDKAGNAQFGVVEFDSSGDLVETAANSGIGVIKAAGVTNPKVNPGAASTLKGTNSLVAVDDIILGSGLSLTAGAAPTLSVDQSTFDKAGNAQFGVVEFDSSGDLVETAANSGIGVIKAAGVTNPKVNPGAASTLKGTNSLVAVDDIILGSGLSLTAGAAPTLSVDQSTFDKAGNAQFGVVEFDSSGDLVETAANSGIGVIKAAGVTNPKVNPGAASTLKGTNSLVAVDDIILGSGLSLTAGAAPTLSVDQSTFDKAGNAQFGVVEFDSSGDLVETAANSGIGVIKAAGVTNPKVNPGAASTLKGTNSLVAVDDIILGSGLSLTAGAGPTISVKMNVVQTAVNYVVLSGNTIVEVTNTSVARTVTLPSASSVNAGQRIIVKDTSGNANSGNITVTSPSGTIDGLVSFIINIGYGSAEFFSDGVGWFSVGLVTSSPAYAGFFLANASGIAGLTVQINVQPYAVISTAGRINFSTWTSQGTTLGITVGTNTLTTIRAGLYKISFTGLFGPSSTNTGNPFVQMVKNSASVLGFVRSIGNILFTNGAISWTGNLNAGDVIDFRTGIDVSASFGLFNGGIYINQVAPSTNVSSSSNNSLVQFTGGISYPTLTGIGTTSITYTAFTIYTRYTNSGVDTREVWSYPGGVYTPTWPNGSSQQATYIAFVPDYTTIATTKSLKIVEYGFYRQFPSREAAEIVFYTIATRDTATTFFTSFVSFMQGYYGTKYADKLKIFYKGSVSLNTLAYRITPESSNVGAVVGTYYNLATGAAEVAGRNYLNDIFSTYTITNDPAIQGAASNMTVTVAGRGTIGNEGEQFFRVTGSTAKIFGSSTNVIYEPIDANSTADYAIVPVNKWTYYKLLLLPGSRIIVVQPNNNAASNTAATAIAVTHIYDTSPYNTYDRWLPTIFVGYMAVNGSLNLNASWATNAGLYAFYDTNKVQYA